MSGPTTKGGKHRVSPGSAPNAGATRRPTKKRGFFRRFWWLFVVVPLVAVLAFAGTIAYVYAKTKIPQAPPGPQTTYIYDSDGKLITTLHSEVNRTVIPFSAIPDDMKHAIIAIEDKNYYHEGGISPFSIVRAAWADLTHRTVVQGGSTITQQYVKNVYTGSERTFARKIREAILAVKVAHAYTKDEILGKYLNTVYFGNGAYGVQAAAETYWGIRARDLDTLQAATLAGLVSAPALYDPVNHPDQAKVRRNLVLRAMAQQGYITEADAQKLQDEPVKVQPRRVQVTPYAYFVDYVRRALQARYGEDETFTGGLRVVTTLDRSMQEAAEKAVADHLTSPQDPAAALVAIDPATGAIRAMVGGRDFRKAKFNYATQAHRQAGSSFKPFTLTAAIEDGISPKSVWNGPPSITIPDPKCYTNGKPWQVSNFADESAGTMTLLDATAHSVNTIFAQLVVQVTPQKVVDVAHEMGIESDLQPVCSITLGSQGVTPLEMADAYATLASRGIRHAPESIERVKTAAGSLLDEPQTDGQRALPQNTADVVTYALEGVIQRGTGVAANIGRPAAGKTGTAQNYVDAWFCGYTPQLVACVWMGYPKTEDRPMENVEGYSTVFGGSLPALIWHDFMTAALANVPARGFATPDFAGLNTNPKGSTPTPSPRPSPSPTPSPTASPLPRTTPPPTTPPPTTTPPTTPPPTTPPSPTPSVSVTP